MARTLHGHHIPNTPYETDDAPLWRARCGGPLLCGICAQEVARAQTLLEDFVTMKDLYNQSKTNTPALNMKQVGWMIKGGKFDGILVNMQFAALDSFKRLVTHTELVPVYSENTVDDAQLELINNQLQNNL